MKLTVVTENTKREVFTDCGKDLLSVLRENGFDVSASCGGMGKCGKCTVTIERNGIRENVLSCKTSAEDGMTVYIQASNGAGIATDVEVVPDGEDGLGVAIDVGTTTVVIYFVDLSTGKTIKTESFLNPQRSYGADVVSRILYATEHGTAQLKDALISSINCVLGGFLKKSD